MKIPVIEKFFGCVELRNATIGIGWGYGILLAISFVGFLLSLFGNNSHSQTGSAIATSIISLISILFCAFLIIGGQRERESYVRMGMYFLIVHSVLLAITCLVRLLSVGLIVLFVYLPLTVYCALTVRSYLLQLTGHSTSPGGV